MSNALLDATESAVQAVSGLLNDAGDRLSAVWPDELPLHRRSRRSWPTALIVIAGVALVAYVAMVMRRRTKDRQWRGADGTAGLDDTPRGNSD